MTIVAGLVLLVGCANIAGLLLGRGAARRREIGVRLALGASRGRLIRQLLTESLVLAIARRRLWTVSGGVAHRDVRRALVQSAASRSNLDLALDRRMLVYALLLSVVTAVLCGLAPARRATRLAVVPALKDDDQTPQRQRLRAWLIVGQVGLSFALILWGGLFARSLSNAQQVDRRIRSVRRRPRSPATRRRRGSIRARSAAAWQNCSHACEASRAWRVRASRRLCRWRSADAKKRRCARAPMPDSGPQRRVLVNRVSPGWFQTLRIPLLAGRDFSRGDGAGVAAGGHRQRDRGAAVLERRRARQTPQRCRSRRRRAGTASTGRSARPSGRRSTRPTTQRLESEVDSVRAHVGHGRDHEGAARRNPPAGSGMIVDVQPMTDAVGAAFVPTQDRRDRNQRASARSARCWR